MLVSDWTIETEGTNKNWGSRERHFTATMAGSITGDFLTRQLSTTYIKGKLPAVSQY